jgi:hypothetical protein
MAGSGLDLGVFLVNNSEYKVRVSENDSQPNYLINKFTSSDSSVTITETNDGGVETIDLLAGGGGGVDFGEPFALADSSGAYTGYATFQDAIDASVSGQTVQMVTDVIETGNITTTLKDGVNVNFNGFTYTLDNAGTSSSLSLPEDSSVKLFNGTVRRISGSPSNSDSVCLYVNNVAGSIVENFGMVYENDFGASLRLDKGAVTGGTFKGETYGCFIASSTSIARGLRGYGSTIYGIYSLNSANVSGCYGYSRDVAGIFVNASKLYDSKGESDGAQGILVQNSKVYDIKGYSTVAEGVKMKANISGSLIFGYSSASIGVLIDAKANVSNVTGHSIASHGFRFSSGNGLSQLNGVSAHSTASPASEFYLNGTKPLRVSGLRALCEWDDASGHGISIQGNNDNRYFIGGEVIVTNASANCIYSAAAENIYYVGMSFIGATVSVNANTTNLQANTADSFGNITVG